MCGIAGFVSAQTCGLPSLEIQRRILDSMEKRGPDESGQWIHPYNEAFFLHRRLSIRDLSPHGAQPMTSADKRFTIVFNGEIYNSDALRTWMPDYPFRGTSDTECILALYQQFGAQMLPFLRGMYAFAIWDDDTEALFLARDPYGIKPLYLAQTPDGLWFASQVKSLLHVPQIDLSPAPAGHAGFFLWGSVPEPYSLYKGISALRSGHSLWMQRGKEPQIQQFASISKSLAEAYPLPQDEPATVRLQSAIHDSVRAHFASDVPVATFLSAGLDSSTILATAADIFPHHDLSALTLGFEAYRGTPHDETAGAALIAKQYGVPLQTQTIGLADFTAEAQHFLHAMDQPSIDGVNTYFIAKMAKQAGYKVALSGIGGDELFGGYGSFQQIPQAVKLVRATGIPRKFGRIFRQLIERYLARVTSPKYGGLLEYGSTVEGAYLLRRGLFMPWELPEVLDPDLAIAGLEELENSAFEIEELKRLEKHPLRLQVGFLESTRYMRNQLLRDADWAGMAHSVEIRTPLVDFFLLKQIAWLLGSKSPPSKLAMAKTPHQTLPEEILYRKKTGFAVPVREWLAASFPEKPERGLRSWAKFVYRQQWSVD